MLRYPFFHITRRRAHVVNRRSRSVSADRRRDRAIARTLRAIGVLLPAAGWGTAPVYADDSSSDLRADAATAAGMNQAASSHASSNPYVEMSLDELMSVRGTSVSGLPEQTRGRQRRPLFRRRTRRHPVASRRLRPPGPRPHLRPTPNLEISVWGQNLLDSGHVEYLDTRINRLPIDIQRGVCISMTDRF
ncbi:MAG: hypothetical protein WC058_07060 [Phycisphaeraceae bacterium]